MNWIERMHEIKGKDLYSQNGEGLLLEYVFHQLDIDPKGIYPSFIDIGGGDGFYLSNTHHLQNLGWDDFVLDKENGHFITAENVNEYMSDQVDLISIDIDGNDYWILEKILSANIKPSVIIAEFNPAFIGARTIKYNPNHVWNGDDYYGFSFEAGVSLAERFGYKVIFQVADMNMIMVRADLVEGLYIPPVNFKQNDFFQKSNRTDWVYL